MSFVCGCSLSLDLDGPPPVTVLGCGPEEICNGFDDDCDNRIDEETTRRCYTGPEETLEIGPCRSGVRRCLSEIGTGVEIWSTCEGEVLPDREVCNDLDDDCDGEIDRTQGDPVTKACFPFDSGSPGVGRCRAGRMICDFGEYGDCRAAVGPIIESKNEIDDDCDGRLDED